MIGEAKAPQPPGSAVPVCACVFGGKDGGRVITMQWKLGNTLIMKFISCVDWYISLTYSTLGDTQVNTGNKFHISTYLCTVVTHINNLKTATFQVLRTHHIFKGSGMLHSQ